MPPLECGDAVKCGKLFRLTSYAGGRHCQWQRGSFSKNETLQLLEGVTTANCVKSLRNVTEMLWNYGINDSSKSSFEDDHKFTPTFKRLKYLN